MRHNYYCAIVLVCSTMITLYFHTDYEDIFDSFFGTGTGNICFEHLYCLGFERSLGECHFFEEDLIITCNTTAIDNIGIRCQEEG